ncbi:MAG: VOC family protein, partial [Pseudomonadota bacterium]
DVHRRYQELVDQGIKFDSPPKREQWRWEEARFSDPSGNKLCLLHAGQERRFPPWRLTDS